MHHRRQDSHHHLPSRGLHARRQGGYDLRQGFTQVSKPPSTGCIQAYCLFRNRLASGEKLKTWGDPTTIGYNDCSVCLVQGVEGIPRWVCLFVCLLVDLFAGLLVYSFPLGGEERRSLSGEKRRNSITIKLSLLITSLFYSRTSNI